MYFLQNGYICKETGFAKGIFFLWNFIYKYYLDKMNNEYIPVSNVETAWINLIGE